MLKLFLAFSNGLMAIMTTSQANIESKAFKVYLMAIITTSQARIKALARGFKNVEYFWLIKQDIPSYTDIGQVKQRYYFNITKLLLQLAYATCGLIKC